MLEEEEEVQIIMPLPVQVVQVVAETVAHPQIQQEAQGQLILAVVAVVAVIAQFPRREAQVVPA